MVVIKGIPILCSIIADLSAQPSEYPGLDKDLEPRILFDVTRVFAWSTEMAEVIALFQLGSDPAADTAFVLLGFANLHVAVFYELKKLIDDHADGNKLLTYHVACPSTQSSDQSKSCNYFVGIAQY